MALSFEESRKKLMARAESPVMAMAMEMPQSGEDEAVAAVVDSASDGFEISQKYLWYDTYSDDKYSSVDSLKTSKWMTARSILHRSRTASISPSRCRATMTALT